VKLLLDMNLSPVWVKVLADAGFEAIHWSSVGAPTARDEEIMRFAAEHGFVVFTHDLDFGTLLALTKQTKPSVVQVRTRDVLPAAIGNLVITLLHRFAEELERGAVAVVDPVKPRVRILPLKH